MRGACVSEVSTNYNISARPREMCALWNRIRIPYETSQLQPHGRVRAMETHGTGAGRRRGDRRTAVARRCVTDLAVPCHTCCLKHPPPMSRGTDAPRSPGALTSQVGPR